MPVLFLGHGSPMNAIEDNQFSRGWRKIGETIPRPKAILCISAHRETIPQSMPVHRSFWESVPSVNLEISVINTTVTGASVSPGKSL